MNPCSQPSRRPARGKLEPSAIAGRALVLLVACLSLPLMAAETPNQTVAPAALLTNMAATQTNPQAAGAPSSAQPTQPLVAPTGFEATKTSQPALQPERPAQLDTILQRLEEIRSNQAGMERSQDGRGVSRALLWCAIPVLALTLVNTGAVLSLFRAVRGGNMPRGMVSSSARSSPATGAGNGRAEVSPKVEAMLRQAKAQAAETQQQLGGALDQLRTEARNLAGLLGRLPAEEQLAPMAQQSEKISQILSALAERVEEMKTVCNQTGVVAMDLKQQMHDKRKLESLEHQMQQQLASLHQREQAFAREREAFQAEKQKLNREQAERGQALEQALWPAAFRDGAGLGEWRERITKSASQGDLPATGLMLAVMEFHYLWRQLEPKLSQIGAALRQLSLEAHRFWKDQPGDFNDTALRWRDEFNALLAERAWPLEVQAVFPQARFDTNCMVCAEGSSSSRLYVKEPLSWVILDKSNPEKPLVMHHGVMLTV